MKISWLVALAFGFSMPVLANPYGQGGCGLGSIMFGKKHQVLAATFNNSSGNQTFGITSGTSNCVQGAKMALVPFIKTNKAQLENDAAKGAGESLVSLGSLMGCSQQNVLNQQLQQDYEQIFISGNSAQDISDRILLSAGSRNDLKQSCQIFL